MRQSKSKMRFLATEIIALKRFQERQGLKNEGDYSCRDIVAVNETIIAMEKQFWYKYNNLKK